jgi:hypothetical protein
MTIVHASLANIHDSEPTPDEWDALVRECNELGWPDVYEDEAPELSWDAEFDPDTEWMIDRLADDFEPSEADRVWLCKQRGADEEAPDYHAMLTVSAFDHHQSLID